MHTTIKYTQNSKAERRAKAIQDIVEYLGQEQFDKMTADFKTQAPMDISSWTLALSFGGITGYPVKAWYETIWPNAAFTWPTDF